MSQETTEKRLMWRKFSEPRQWSQRADTHRHRQSVCCLAGRSAGSPGWSVSVLRSPELLGSNTLEVLIHLAFSSYFDCHPPEKATPIPTLWALFVSLYPDRSQHLGRETSRQWSGISGQQRQRLRPTCSPSTVKPAGGRERESGGRAWACAERLLLRIRDRLMRRWPVLEV